MIAAIVPIIGGTFWLVDGATKINNFFKIFHSDDRKIFEQKSSGRISPNIIGDHNQITINSTMAQNKTLENSGEISKVKAHLENLVTGGDSYCTVEFVQRRGGPPDIGEWRVIHHGEYPVYDVEVRLIDIDLTIETLQQRNSKTPLVVLPDAEDVATKIFHVGTVTVPYDLSEIGYHDKPLVLESFPLLKEGNYRILINSKNGRVHEEYSISKINGNWIGHHKTSRVVAGHSPIIDEQF